MQSKSHKRYSQSQKKNEPYFPSIIKHNPSQYSNRNNKTKQSIQIQIQNELISQKDSKNNEQKYGRIRKQNIPQERQLLIRKINTKSIISKHIKTQNNIIQETNDSLQNLIHNQSPPTEKMKKKNIQQIFSNKNRIKKNQTSINEHQMFEQIKNIIKNKISAKNILLLPNTPSKYSSAINKYEKLLQLGNPQFTVSRLKQEMQMDRQKIHEIDNSDSLKDEENYHEWRRMQLYVGKQSSPKYKKSTFQLQNKRLKEYILKNQITLQNYLKRRQQLLKLKSTTLQKQK